MRAHFFTRLRAHKGAWLRWLFPVLGVAAFGLGFLGFLAKPNGACATGCSLHRALLLTLQLYVANVDPDKLTTWPTQWASLLAPAATAGAAVLAFQARIRRRLGFLRLFRRPADTVFIGGGNLAAAILAQRIRQIGSHESIDAPGCAPRVAVLDPAADAPLARLIAGAGDRIVGFTAVGDGRSADGLIDVNAPEADRVWVLAGDDIRSLEITRALIQLRRGAPAGARPQSIAVCLRDVSLARAERDLRAQGNQGLPAHTHVEYFDLARTAARRLLADHPPAYPLLEQDATLHLCVVGDGDWARAIVAHAAMHCVYDESPARAVRITLIGLHASAQLDALYRRHPALHPDAAAADPALASLLPLARLHAFDADPARITVAQWLALTRDAPFDKIYVATDHDLPTFGAVRRVLALQDACAARGLAAAPVVACLNDRPGDPLEDDGAWPDSVERFDIFARCFGPGEAYPGASADSRAMLVERAYARVDPAEVARGGPPTDDERRQWRNVPEAFRWSSRLSADHMGVKLAILGIDGTDRQRAADLAQQRIASDDVMRRLMRLEHRRFVVERLVDGWLQLDRPALRAGEAPSGLVYAGAPAGVRTQKKFLDLNETLVDFDSLAEGDRDKDRFVVEAMPGCLRDEPAR